MKKILLFMIVLYFGVWSTIADAPNPDCENTPTMYDVNMCAGRAFDKADKKLNRIYNSTLGSIRDEIKQAKTKYEKEKLILYNKAYIEAQRHWVKFKEAFCQGVVASNSEGSGQSSTVLACQTQLTQERIAHLEKEF